MQDDIKQSVRKSKNKLKSWKYGYDKDYDIIIANFANPDMVGHSGNYESTLKAVEYVDECIGKIFKATNEKNSILILTSDHGNSETMWDENQKSKHTAHTNNQVPFILVNGDDGIKLNKGKLSDIAPTPMYCACPHIDAKCSSLLLSKTS